VQLDDGKTRDGFQRVENARDIDHSGAVAVVFDHS
jgi:hypothetical protein